MFRIRVEENHCRDTACRIPTVMSVCTPNLNIYACGKLESPYASISSTVRLTLGKPGTVIVSPRPIRRTCWYESAARLE